MKRREFLKKSIAASAAITAAANTPVLGNTATSPGHPIVIASGNGEAVVKRSINQLKVGAPVLDAIVSGVQILEDDPNDLTVGYGGLPNEAGVVQLDAAVMHGPTHNAGAVGSLENVRYAAKLAQLVMERSDHVLLVGEGALNFARAHGFREENLLTDKSRKIWLKWKEKLNPEDKWLPGPEDEYSDLLHQYKSTYGTVHCSAMDSNGDLASVTTTSGFAFKIPGRVGDSPIIGAGLYTDNEVGSAGSVGRGEANLKNLSCFMIVEFMRMGKSPQEACLEVCKRIVSHTKLPHLLKPNGKPNFSVNFYAINKKGEVGGAGIYEPWSGLWVADPSGAKEIEIGYLYKREND